MDFPENLRYTKTHEWIAVQGTKAKVGVTEYAQKEISDVVFVELPKKGQVVQQGKTAAVVESVKAASDLYAPVAGSVLAVNAALDGAPEKVNQSPFDGGWMIKLKIATAADVGALLSPDDYSKLTG